MTESEGDARPSRRAFLLAARNAVGLLAAAVTLPATVGSPQFAASRPPAKAKTTGQFIIGVLLPESKRYPALGQQLFDGVRLFFDQQPAYHARLSFVTAQYSSPYDSLRQAGHLITERRADVLAGMLSRNEASALEPLLEEYQVPLVVSDVGANVVQQANPNGSVFRSSLNAWQANLALGAWASANRGTRALVATSFYEAGYDTLYAFRHGFEQNGGTVLDTYVTHQPAVATDLTTVMAAIQTAKPDVVYASYSGREAVDFAQAYDTAGLAGQVPLLGSAFFADAALLPHYGRSALGLASVQSWSPALPLAEQRAFATTFHAATGRRADHFAVLGYDTARLIKAALSVGGTRDLEAARQAFRMASFHGPRGHITVDPDTLEATSPLYLHEVRGGSQAAYNAFITELDHSIVLNTYAPSLRRDLRSGWLEAYLAG